MVKFRDAEVQAEFERNGFVVRRILDDEEVAEARVRLDAAAAGRSFERNDCEDTYYSSMFEREPVFQSRLRDAMARIFYPKLDAELSDSRYFETSLLYKPPNSRALNVHQHVPITEQPFATSVFCWCALEDADENSGTLLLVPGSHHLLRFIRTLQTDEYFLDYRDEVTRRHAIPVPLKAGEAILFENSLLHGSVPNLTERPRRAVLTIVMHEGAQHVLYQHDQSGETVMLDNDFDEIQIQTMYPGGSQVAAREIGRLPAWDAKPTLEEFETLLQRGQRASKDSDPLAALRAERAASWRGRLSRMVGLRA
jgi:ectoine hydroxylase-related dioxygenase (phytanoyl-CoA dioxygenase family)